MKTNALSSEPKSFRKITDKFLLRTLLSQYINDE